eukprot:5631588-Amphidinium_carterae.2
MMSAFEDCKIQSNKNKRLLGGTLRMHTKTHHKCEAAPPIEKIRTHHDTSMQQLGEVLTAAVEDACCEDSSDHFHTN